MKFFHLFFFAVKTKNNAILCFKHKIVYSVWILLCLNHFSIFQLFPNLQSLRASFPNSRGPASIPKILKKNTRLGVNRLVLIIALLDKNQKASHKKKNNSVNSWRWFWVARNQTRSQSPLESHRAQSWGQFCSSYISMTFLRTSYPKSAYLLTIQRYIWPLYKTILIGLSVWESHWDMESNPSKCQMVQVTASRKPIASECKLHGQVLETVTSAKYLGADLSSNMSWGPHIDRTGIFLPSWTWGWGPLILGKLARKFTKLEKLEQKKKNRSFIF